MGLMGLMGDIGAEGVEGDAAFVEGLADNDAGQAEGVETVDQIILLKENGCFFVQGYYFDRPLPMAEFEMRLQELTKITHRERMAS